MHRISTNFGARYFGVVILAAVIVVVVAICWGRIRHGEKPWLTGILGAYEVLLVALFTVGLLGDDGYGWAFFPVMMLSAPWSFMLSMIPRGFVMDWFASGWFGNFVLFVVICGGVNSFLLYIVISKVFYPSSASVKQGLLGGRPD